MRYHAVSGLIEMSEKSFDYIISESVSRRLASEAAMSNGKAFLIICCGLLILALVTFLGAALLSVAVNYTKDVRKEAEQVAAVLVDAFQRSSLKFDVKGSVELSNPELSVSPASVVRLAANQTIRISPESDLKVSARLQLSAPRPSEAQLALESKTQDGSKPFTSYVVFKDVPFGKGSVETRWIFDVANQVTPVRQDCYYRESVDKNKDLNVKLGSNGSIDRNSAADQLKISLTEAFSACTWWQG